MPKAKVLVVTSGKGGVGKTTSTAALGAALAQAGKNVVVVDFDVGLRNLDLVLGVERRIVYDLTDVVQDITKLPQSLISDRRIPRLSLLPASQTRDKDALTEEGVERVIEHGALCAMRFADAAVIVTNPQVSSIRDSIQIIDMLNSKTQKSENGGRIEQHLLITRYDEVRAKREEMLRIEDVLEFLPIPLLGIIHAAMRSFVA